MKEAIRSRRHAGVRSGHPLMHSEADSEALGAGRRKAVMPPAPLLAFRTSHVLDQRFKRHRLV